MNAVTRHAESIAEMLFLALDLGGTTWKLAFGITREPEPRIRTISARNLPQLLDEIAAAKHRFHLPADAAVRSCYEAGREGFWLHRALCSHGVENVIVDPSSIAVDRRARRAKTDRLDATALLRQLMNATAGDRRGWREVHVPSVEAEADRQLQREWEACKADRNRVRARIYSLLSTQGVRVRLTRRFLDHLALVRVWDGSPVPAALVARLTREWTHYQQIDARRRELLEARRVRVEEASDTVANQVRHLTRLRGIGPNGALTLSTELFAWRRFTNGRQIGACVGLTPTPYRSDQHVHEQGISRSGNRRVRALSVELAWKWLLWQPQSALSRWFHEHFGQHRRARRIGIVALARKLLIALWRYLMTNEIPEGAFVRV
ncbi:MAG TPA: IS110 family transposase [Gemmatimonadales bacterium]|jgi:transposase|nr:IS110 family transposase [Gemmatimonadales bacterium]